MTTQFTGGATSNLDALSVAGATTLAATTISGTTTFGTAPMATPSGSAPIYGCRAWCAFTGSTGVINAGGNIASITRNAAGDYTVAFTTAMADANYSPVINFSAAYAARSSGGAGLFSNPTGWVEVAPSSGGFRFTTVDVAGNLYDPKYVSVAIFR
jgi:hypothetical protein